MQLKSDIALKSHYMAQIIFVYRIHNSVLEISVESVSLEAVTEFTSVTTNVLSACFGGLYNL